MNINWFWSKTYTHQCPDGTQRIIYKDIDKAFPLALKEINSKFGTDVNIQRQMAAKLKAEYQTKINGLLYSISEQNQSLMMTFRSAYIGFTTDPCSDNGFFKRQVEVIQEKQHRLLEIKAQIQGLIALAETYPNGSDKIMATYFDIMNSISGKGVPEMASAEIKENREYAKKWVEGGGNG